MKTNSRHKNTYGRPCILAALLVILCSFSLQAQVKLSANLSRTTVPQNTAFQLTITLSGGRAESFTPPAFSGFTVAGTSHSSGGGMTIYMNGQKVETGGGEESWTYTLLGAKEGKFTLGPAKAKVKGQWVNSNQVTVEITKGSARAANPGSSAGQASAASSGSDGDAFIKAFLSKSNPSLGEQITVTYKIYTRVNIMQYAINKVSGFAGFWTRDLNQDQGDPTLHTETVNGVRYQVAEIRQIALFPQKSGRLTIEPLEVECVIQQRVQASNPFSDFFNDPFFGNPFSSVQNVKRTLRSNALSVNVSPLPEKGKPDQFSGAVGRFTFEASVDRNTVKQHEAITLKISVNGTGNISLIDMPKPVFPSDFEVYDPETRETIEKNSNPVRGSKTFEYLVIPATAGDFTIPGLVFSYYDPSIRSYKTLRSSDIAIKVEKGNESASAGTGPRSSAELIGQDIRYVATPVLPLSTQNSTFPGVWWFWLLLLIPVALFTAFLLIWRRQIRINNDVALRRNLRATHMARKRLEVAGKLMNEGKREAFFEETSRAVWGYVGDKFTIPLAELSIANVQEILAEKNLDPTVCERLSVLLNRCEYARFAPPDPATEPETVYNEASRIIVDIEKELQQKPGKA